jgi:hypothetical protein
LVKDLKDSIWAINDGAYICTWPNDPFTLELKDSPWWTIGGSSIMLFGFKGPQPRIGGQFGCGVLVRVFLCYVL